MKHIKIDPVRVAAHHNNEIAQVMVGLRDRVELDADSLLSALLEIAFRNIAVGCLLEAAITGQVPIGLAAAMRDAEAYDGVAASTSGMH